MGGAIFHPNLPWPRREESSGIVQSDFILIHVEGVVQRGRTILVDVVLRPESGSFHRTHAQGVSEELGINIITDPQYHRTKSGKSKVLEELLLFAFHLDRLFRDVMLLGNLNSRSGARSMSSDWASLTDLGQRNRPAPKHAQETVQAVGQLLGARVKRVECLNQGLEIGQAG